MPHKNKIDAVIFPAHPEPGVEDPDLRFEAVEYISFVSSPGGASQGTFGIPALLSEERIKSQGLPFSVLYVNPANITAMLATRKA